MSALDHIARATVSRHDMLGDDTAVLAMVSGGADSVALLRLLAAGSLGRLEGLSVLHVNHNLRAEASHADAAFVVSLCESIGVGHRVVSVDIAAHARAEGLNLEDAGRRVRYSLAEQEADLLCSTLGIDPRHGRIAVAHTLDDRLETFLARVVTGAGSGGLSSIAPVRGRIVRPLIDARRVDVTAYLGTLGQDWREDASNADTTRQRAWVRHELLPLIEGRNPAFAVVASRTLGILAEEDSLLADMADAFAHDFTCVDSGTLVLDRPMMLTLTRPMARRCVRQALIDMFPEASRLDFEHTEALVDGLGDDGFARDLPFGLRAEAEYGKLRISRKEDVPPFVAPGLLVLPGTLDVGPAGVVQAFETAPDAPVDQNDRVTIDADAVTWPLVVDAVRDGDRIQPFGMDGTKKVGDLLTDLKVPRRMRDAIPVVRDGDRVVWVAGVRLAESVRVTDGTTRVAELVWCPSEAGTNPLSE